MWSPASDDSCRIETRRWLQAKARRVLPDFAAASQHKPPASSRGPDSGVGDQLDEEATTLAMALPYMPTLMENDGFVGIEDDSFSRDSFSLRPCWVAAWMGLKHGQFKDAYATWRDRERITLKMLNEPFEFTNDFRRILGRVRLDVYHAYCVLFGYSEDRNVYAPSPKQSTTSFVFNETSAHWDVRAFSHLREHAIDTTYQKQLSYIEGAPDAFVGDRGMLLIKYKQICLDNKQVLFDDKWLIEAQTLFFIFDKAQWLDVVVVGLQDTDHLWIWRILRDKSENHLTRLRYRKRRRDSPLPGVVMPRLTDEDVHHEEPVRVTPGDLIMTILPELMKYDPEYDLQYTGADPSMYQYYNEILAETRSLCVYKLSIESIEYFVPMNNNKNSTALHVCRNAGLCLEGTYSYTYTHLDEAFRRVGDAAKPANPLEWKFIDRIRNPIGSKRLLYRSINPFGPSAFLSVYYKTAEDKKNNKPTMYDDTKEPFILSGGTIQRAYFDLPPSKICDFQDMRLEVYQNRDDNETDEVND